MVSRQSGLVVADPEKDLSARAAGQRRCMKVLVIGKTGQLARELARKSWPQGWSAEFLDRAAVDLSEPDIAADAVGRREPDLVINAAAYTQVDKAESEP